MPASSLAPANIRSLSVTAPPRWAARRAVRPACARPAAYLHVQSCDDMSLPTRQLTPSSIKLRKRVP
jgi:hypothetical protein